MQMKVLLILHKKPAITSTEPSPLYMSYVKEHRQKTESKRARHAIQLPHIHCSAM